MLPEHFTLSGRIGGDDDTTDIELRTPTEKFTIASDVDDRFAPLFLASPDLLAACEAAESILDSLVIDEATQKAGLWQGPGPMRVLNTLRSAIAKARGI